MSIITFISEDIKETGQTISISAIATAMAIEHNYKILLVSTEFIDKTLENCFWDSSNRLTGLFARSNVMDVSNGLEGLIRTFASNRASGDIIRSYTKPVLKDRVYNKISFIAKKDFNLSSITFKISVNSGEVVKIDLQHNDKVIDVGNYLLGDTIVIEQDLKIKSGDTLCIIFENTNTEFSIYKLNMKK